MGRIVSWCLKNKSVVFLATLLLIGSGVFATTRLNQELLPDVDFPVVLVSTPVPGRVRTWWTSRSASLWRV
jgi:hydrophobic/amphiphilic exporter-1 (mainly G- bacteria), HAE1 family